MNNTRGLPDCEPGIEEVADQYWDDPSRRTPLSLPDLDHPIEDSKDGLPFEDQHEEESDHRV